jgi:hypothetical protein
MQKKHPICGAFCLPAYSDLLISQRLLSVFIRFYLRRLGYIDDRQTKPNDINREGVIFVEKKLDEEKIENQITKNGDALTSFDDFREYLSGKVRLGEKLGMDEEQLANSAQKVADYLADKEPPRNSEERLLQELWKVGTEEEQHKLAHMLVRLVQQY